MYDLTKFGGKAVPIMQGAGGTAYNFGITGRNPECDRMLAAQRSLYDKYPNLRGKWDGKTTINGWDAIRKVLGGEDKAEELIQYQPRGTCGGRAGSFGLDSVQCTSIAYGTAKGKFKRASHAWLYWQARKKYGMDKGNPNDDNNDGVASGSIPEIMALYGADNREESGDTNAYGQGSDDLACKWGCGQINPELAKKLSELAKDNIVTDYSPVGSAAEAADAIAGGAYIIGCCNTGFTMERDFQGFCRRQGNWSHYHGRISIGNYGGRKGFGYVQSWGKGTPSGTLLPGHPSNCFGVDFDVQDDIIRNSNWGDWVAVFSIPLFDIQEAKYKLDWML